MLRLATRSVQRASVPRIVSLTSPNSCLPTYWQLSLLSPPLSIYFRTSPHILLSDSLHCSTPYAVALKYLCRCNPPSSNTSSWAPLKAARIIRRSSRHTGIPILGTKASCVSLSQIVARWKQAAPELSYNCHALLDGDKYLQTPVRHIPSRPFICQHPHFDSPSFSKK